MREDLTQMPTGGLASFLTSNMDEIDDNVLAFGKASGINSMSKIANRMANMGRNGDNELVHVKTGELIVSPEVLEKNPKLAQEFSAEDKEPSAQVTKTENDISCRRERTHANRSPRRAS